MQPGPAPVPAPRPALELIEGANRRPDRESLLESALDAIVSVGADDRILEFNPSAEKTFGITKAEALGRSLADLIVPPEHREAHRAGVARVAAGEPFRMLGMRLEQQACRADGTIFDCELTITHTSDAPFMVTAFIRDISERRAAEEALRASEERFERAFSQAPMGIALVDIDLEKRGQMLLVNDALCQMLRRSEEDLLATTFGALTHPDDLERSRQMVVDLLAGERDHYELELRMARGDGTWQWSLVHGRMARDAAGTPMYVIGQVEDVTDRREAVEALRQSESALTETQRLARIGSWEYDTAIERFTWSAGLDDVYGASVDDLPPVDLETFLLVVHPEDRQNVRSVVVEAMAGRISRSWEYRVVRNDGRVFHIFAWGDTITSADGEPVCIRGYAQDVSLRRVAEARAAGLARENELILEAAGEGIFRLDADGLATFVNPAAERLLGYGPDELLGRPVHSVIHHSHEDGTPHPFEECPVRRTSVDGELRTVTSDVFWRRDGSALPVDFTAAPLHTEDGIAGAVIVFNDVTERREMEDQLRRLAELDALTGLLNRRQFEHILGERLGDPAGGALLLIDLDHFKYVNDSFGHAAGDDLLRAIAALLVEGTREGDLLARLGGDEFSILLPGADEEEAHAIASRIISAIDASRPSGVAIGASIGVACFGAGRQSTAGDLLIAADIALYDAKDAGRGRVSSFTGKPGTSLAWVQRIREALDDDRLVVHSQPIFELGSGMQVQEELLVRMIDHDGATLPPNSFLPTAEAFGLIADIDRWVLARGVDLAAQGRCVHVNLSGRSLGDPALPDHLEQLLRDRGADPRLLVVELTETLAVGNMANARLLAQRLAELGCGLALDDFGTGFGSFTLLKHLTADFLKIDMEFVRELTTSEADRRVVGSVVSIARRFGLRTIAEGVEDEETLSALRAAGVDYAQGYHLGRPAPVQR